MIKILKTNFKFFLFFLCVTSISSQTISKNIMDVIKEDSELSIFYANLKKTGLDEVLQKKLPWKWTIFAPTDKASKLHQKESKKKFYQTNFTIKV